MINSTQTVIPIKNIRNDLVVLQDGSIALVLQTSAVNFDLLSENEQVAIIGSFAGLLNSLSFPIQIVIRSKRLDISNYLQLLDKARESQQSPLLKEMIARYRDFIQVTIQENEVLDKQFYVAVLLSKLELGLIGDEERMFQKATTILMPRRDHLIRQLERNGLRATQLDTEKLIRLYYDIYNEPAQVKKSANQDEQAAVPAQDAATAAPEKPEEVKPAENTPPAAPVEEKPMETVQVNGKVTIPTYNIVDADKKLGSNQPDPALLKQQATDMAPKKDAAPAQNKLGGRSGPYVVEVLPE